MKYEQLTAEQKLSITNSRIQGFEAEHFAASLDLRAAKKTDNEVMQDSAEDRIKSSEEVLKPLREQASSLEHAAAEEVKAAEQEARRQVEQEGANDE